jgi:hypothetical protein
MGTYDWGLVDPRTSRFSNTSNVWDTEGINTPNNNTILSQNSSGAMAIAAGIPEDGNFVTPLVGSGDPYGDSNYKNDFHSWISNIPAKSPSPTYAVTDTWGLRPAPVNYSPGLASTPPAPPVFPAASTVAYYADMDGVVRPADGLYVNGSTGDGYMTFTTNKGNPNNTTAGASPGTADNTDTLAPPTQHGRRPVILNRPFRSVAELGYVFRDEPFKTLDMFSQSSADAALLDVFSITDQARIVPATVAGNYNIDTMTSGQVNISNAPVPVLTALLSVGAKKDVDPNFYMPGKANADAALLASGIATQLSPSPTGTGPLFNRANLVTSLGPAIHNAFLNGRTANPPPEAGNKTYLEAPVRALSDVTNTRTWNLMIDIIAQSGEMSPSATTLNDFVVQGEKRYWLHIAIDRYTGKIIDQQLEPVYE